MAIQETSRPKTRRQPRKTAAEAPPETAGVETSVAADQQVGAGVESGAADAAATGAKAGRAKAKKAVKKTVKKAAAKKAPAKKKAAAKTTRKRAAKGAEAEAAEAAAKADEVESAPPAPAMQSAIEATAGTGRAPAQAAEGEGSWSQASVHTVPLTVGIAGRQEAAAADEDVAPPDLGDAPGTDDRDDQTARPAARETEAEHERELEHRHERQHQEHGQPPHGQQPREHHRQPLHLRPRGQEPNRRVNPDMKADRGGFEQFGFKPDLMKAIAAMGFEQPSEIQRQLIPVALTGKDVLGQSKTGSGKTASFLLPILQQLDPDPVIQALILVPTRELCQQVNEECKKLSRFAPVRSVSIVGGRQMKGQLDELRRGPRVVVGTPGRILDHLGRGTLNLGHIRFAVLDEVDRMLDIGFLPDIRQILKSIRSSRHQTIFVSATISDEIARLAGQFMHEPEKIYLAPDDLTVPQVEQFYCPVERHDKYRLLKRLLHQEKPACAIIFSATKRMADDLADRMTRDGLNAVEIHGDLQQSQREKVIARFRKGDIRYLVATDLAARGLDIPEVTHIINYDIPNDPEGYVHRIGRTARMGATGKAITFVTREEGPYLTEIEMLINKEVHPLKVEGFEPTIREERREAAPPPRPPSQPLSRFKQPAFTVDETTFPAANGPIRVPVKTLGSKFAPARRRRR